MRVTQDRRLKHVTSLSCADTAQRLFPEWTGPGIDSSKIKPDILSRHAVNGVFDPARMTQFATEDRCCTLSGVTGGPMRPEVRSSRFGWAGLHGLGAFRGRPDPARCERRTGCW